jgi:hypothetical protein
MTCNERVIVEYDVTSWTRRDPPWGSGTRTQHISSALPNIQGRDPGNDLLLIVRLFQHGIFLSVITSNRKGLPAGAAGTVANLVRVLKGNKERPNAKLPVPDYLTASQDQEQTASAGNRNPFSARTGAPEGHRGLFVSLGPITYLPGPSVVQPGGWLIWSPGAR